MTKTCEHCGVSFVSSQRGAAGRATRFCSYTCRGAALRREKHHNFRGGREVLKTGYVRLRDRTNPRAYRNRLFEHIVVAEAALGHALPPKAVVHHVDGNKSNNSPSNLVICQDHAYHMLLHARARRLKEFGSLEVRRCKTCHEAKPLADFNNDRSSWDGHCDNCRSCDKTGRRERYLRTRLQEAHQQPQAIQ